jgi:hypothetical protein
MEPECIEGRAAQLAQMSNSAGDGGEAVDARKEGLPCSCPGCIDVVHKKLKLHYFEISNLTAWKIVKVFAKFWH